MTAVFAKIFPDPGNTKALVWLWLGFHTIVASLVVFTAVPLLALSVLLLILLFAFYIFSVDNYHECIGLLLLLFGIEILYSGSGRFALLAGYTVMLTLVASRSMAQGMADWQNALFIKEMLIFTAVAFLSLFWGDFVFNGFRLFTINLAFGLVVFGLTHVICMNRASYYHLTWFLILILVVNAIYGTVNFIATGDRAASFFVDTPTYSGHFFVQGLCLSLAAYLAPPFKRLKKVLLLIIVGFLVAIFLSITRAAWLALFFLGILVLLFSPIPRRYLVYGFVLTASAIVLAFLLVSREQLIWAIQERVTEDVQNASMNMGSIAFRVLLWQSAWQLFLENPLLGIGFDNFVLKNVSTAYFPFLKALGGEGLYVHNVYLQLMAELGIIGILAFLNLIFAVYKKFIQMLKSVPGDDYRYVLIGYGGTLALWLFMSLTEAALYTPITAAFFFFYVGMISGFNKILVTESRARAL